MAFMPIVPPPSSDVPDWPAFSEQLTTLDRLRTRHEAVEADLNQLHRERQQMIDRGERASITAVVKGDDPPPPPDTTEIDEQIDQTRRLKDLTLAAIEEAEAELLALPAREPHQLDAVEARIEAARAEEQAALDAAGEAHDQRLSLEATLRWLRNAPSGSPKYLQHRLRDTVVVGLPDRRGEYYTARVALAALREAVHPQALPPSLPMMPRPPEPTIEPTLIVPTIYPEVDA